MFMAYKSLKKSIHPLPQPSQLAACASSGEKDNISSGATAASILESRRQGEAVRKRKQSRDPENASALSDDDSETHAEHQDEASAVARAGDGAEPHSSSGTVALPREQMQHAQTRPKLTQAEREDLTLKNEQFFRELRHEVDKVNAFFLDKQEDYVILAEQLERDVADAIQSRAPRSQIIELKRRLIEFHGCLVLLDNYSLVNFQGFRKILKKHDKKTGLNIRDAYLSAVLVTPFLLGDTVRKLLRNTEQHLEELDAVSKRRRVAEPGDGIPADGSREAAGGASALSVASAQQALAPSEVTYHSVATAVAALQPDVAAAMRAAQDQPCSVAPPELPPTAYAQGDPFPQQPIQPAGAAEVAVAPYPTSAHPQACIGPHSALYRAWRDASAHVEQLAASLGSGGDGHPGQSLLDSVDAITATELGISFPFLRGTRGPTNYVIADTDRLSFGFVVIGPGDRPFQLFRRTRSDLVVSRLLRGRATVKYLRPGPSSNCSDETVACEDPAELDDSSRLLDGDGMSDTHPVAEMASHDGHGTQVQHLDPAVLGETGGALNGAGASSNQPDFAAGLLAVSGSRDSRPPPELDLYELRGGTAAGPWPAVWPARASDCIQWTPLEENVAIFYITSPPLDAREMPCYELTAVQAGCESAAAEDSAAAPSYHATLLPHGLTFERMRCW
jgi:hypothetical protein